VAAVSRSVLVQVPNLFHWCPLEVAAPVILPLFAMAADECPDVGKSMPDTPAEIAPLLVMPPVKVETPIARIPLPPADSVPLLTIPPKRTSQPRAGPLSLRLL
jgi:hypothetical protein